MKRTLFLASVMASILADATAATYTELTSAWCDESNNVIYNGQGYFAVESAANTEVQLVIDLASLHSYVNSNDYTGSSYMLQWENNILNYGLGDYADTSLETGSRTPDITGWANNSTWSQTTRISYEDLSRCADSQGKITLTITNHTSNGVTVSATSTTGGTETLYAASSLKYGAMTEVTGYYVNLNYVTAVTLNTVSTLDTANYVPSVDYSLPFVSQRTDGTSIGRVTFLGDSITHGVSDQSYRWQFFKILTDNGIENEIAGPREGYYNTSSHTRDAGSSYGGTEFANVHLAQASGRTHNIITGSTFACHNDTQYQSGVNYGGHSTTSTAESFDSNTWFCMMGTNDLLSDTTNSVTTAQYSAQMQKMLGGTVVYSADDDRYTWTSGTDWGTMSTIVSDVCTDGDTFYMLSITPWGNHSNHNRDMDHYAGAEFNRLLEAWTQAYSAHTGRNVIYVDVTRGMVDVSSGTRNMGHNAFFNSTSDRLHPNEQGALIMAGNLARAMGIGGRTAGLQRMASSGWSGATIGTVAAGTTQLVAENAFTMEGGYTIDFSAHFGNGATDGWLGADSALSIALGDGTNSGILNLSESAIMWGSDVLFCWDNSTLADEGNLRIAWHNGNAADNMLSGYYVWLNDMLIGQGLSATQDSGLNGILISASGTEGSITGLTWTDQAYAPTTRGLASAEHACLTTQSAASVSSLVRNTAYTSSGKDFTQASEASLASSSLVTASTSARTVRLTSSSGWVGMTNLANSGEVNVQLTGAVTNTVFGAMNNATNGQLTLELVSGATIGNGTYNGQTAAIAGSYGGGDAAFFHVYMNGGSVGGDIVGGSVNGNGVMNDTKLIFNGGTVTGHVIGGSKVAQGTVHNSSIVVTGGKITGNINAGGDTGTIGNTSVTITGGEITGHILKGSATRENGAEANVTVTGNAARIGGNITADNVTLRDITGSGSATGFDSYAGTITAERLTLDNVQVDLKATLSDGITSIEISNGSRTGAVLGEERTLSRLLLSSDTSFTAYRQDGVDSSDITSVQESTLRISILEVGVGATLNANLTFSSSSELILHGTLTMGSDVDLAAGMTLTLSESMLNQLYGQQAVTLFSGVDTLTLDGNVLAADSTLNANEVFANLNQSYNYTIAYVGGSVQLFIIPEPATATLSLAALAFLATRRRRRK